MTSISTERISGRALVSPALFGRPVTRIVSDEGVEEPLAVRVMDQALAFLGACARHQDAGLSPSPAVDAGWHAFVLHTKEYARFCETVAGRFLHHVPHDTSGFLDEGLSVTATMAVVEASGFVVDPELWRVSGECSEGSGGDGSDTSGKGDCAQCHRGCHSS